MLGIGKKKSKSKSAAGSAAAKPRKEKSPKKKREKKEKKGKEKKPKPAPRDRGITVATPGMNLDTALLGVAALAITFGCLLLFLEISQFGGFGAIKGPL